MAEFCEVFERVEKKYRLSARQYRSIISLLEGKMVPDAYGRTPITSLYFDTPNRSLISRSLEKPRYKEKLRLRAYGPEGSRLRDGLAGAQLTDAQLAGDELGGEPLPVYLEIKKKFEGIVYKRRVCLSLEAARAYWAGASYKQACTAFPLAKRRLAEESLSSRSLQIAHEIDVFRQRYDALAPSMVISCERTAWTPAKDEFGALRDESCANLRITFDERLRYEDLAGASADRPARMQPIIPSDEVIMEIKCKGAYPLWLADALAQAEIYPTSFSKYGKAYMKGGRCA